MTCHRFETPYGSAILCERGRRVSSQRCGCGVAETHRCDHRIASRKTCSAPLCETCRTHLGKKDYCAAHAAVALSAQTSERSSAGQIRGLTLHRPWTWAIVAGSKRLENRTWWRESTQGLWIALHAGVQWDEKGAARIRAIHPEMPQQEVDHPIGIVGVARVSGVVTSSQDPWFLGPYGWQLEEVVRIEPIRCKGTQRLWVLPDEVLAGVRVRYKAARRRNGVST